MDNPVISRSMIEAKARAYFAARKPMESCGMPRDSPAWETFKKEYERLVHQEKMAGRRKLTTVNK